MIKSYRLHFKFNRQLSILVFVIHLPIILLSFRSFSLLAQLPPFAVFHDHALVEDLVDCSKCSPRSWDGTGSSQELAPAQEHWVEIHVEQNNLVLICCCQVVFDNLSKLFVVDKVVFSNAATQKLTSRWRWWERSWGRSSPQWARWLGSQQAIPDGEENENYEEVDF